MSEFFASILAERKERLERMKNDARQGNISAVQGFFALSDAAGVQMSKYHLLDDLFKMSAEFARPYDLFSALTYKNFDFDEFLLRHKTREALNAIDVDEHTSGYDEKDIWSLYAKDARPETARVAAILAAELMRVRICQGKEAMPDLQGVMGADTGLAAETRKVRIRDSIIATQNALVDYVREEGRTLPLNRGGGFLTVAMDDSSQDLQDFLTRKISDFRQRRFESLQGEKVLLAPVFEGS
jgi:hypothetical protein